MATCHNCGAEMNGQYCETCGARAPEERAAAKRPKKEAPRSTGSARTGGALAPNRVWKTTAMICLGAILFFGGMLAGFYMAGSPGSGPLTSTATDATGSGGTATDVGSLTPLGQAGALMDQGVDAMTKGDRSGAVALFRKSIAQYQTVLKDEPDNLYAQAYMGLTYYYAGDSKNAIDNLNAVLKKDPNYLWGLFNLAWVYETGGKKTEALDMYKKYLAVVDTEKTNELKYAEQLDLIPQQIDAAKKAVESLGGSGK